jgi:hypothetical protein
MVRPVVGVHSVSPTEVVLDVEPPVAARQRLTLLLSRLSAPVDGEPDDVTVTLTSVPAGDPPASQISVDRGAIPDGTWLVRLQVDGAESLPESSAEVLDSPALTLPPP